MMLFVSLMLACGLLGSSGPSADISMSQSLGEFSNVLSNSSESKEVVSRENFGDLSSMLHESSFVDGETEAAADPKFNQLVDFLLDVLRETIRRSGHDQISIPNIDEEFTKKVKHFFKIKVKFHAERGWFRSLASIRRTSDATVVKTGKNITISVGLGLGIVELGFDRYTAKAMHIRVKGKINANIGSNSLLIRVMVDKDKCKLSVLELKVLQLDGIKVRATGLGPLNWLLSRITTSIAKNHKGKIIASLQQNLKTAAAKALDRFHCDGLAASVLQL